MKIVVTGGHHSSALPVINKLQSSYPDLKIFWFGHKYSAMGDKNPTLEFRELTTRGIPFYHIHAGKFYRTLNFKRLLKIPYGFFQCLYLLIKIRPDAILSFGGYISVPTVLAGYVLGIPSITHEQTVVAGWANRAIAGYVKKILVSWEDSKKYFPSGKTFFVGIPLRKEIFKPVSSNFKVNSSLPTVYVTTGKIGSHIINMTVKDSLKELLSFCNVIHQCGDNSVYNDYLALEEVSKNLPDTPGRYFLRKFVLENEIGEAYTKANLVVSRAGAHTTAELLALQKHCLLIPIPWVSHNEQNKNAEVLVKAGLGTTLSEGDLTAEKLILNVKELLKDKREPEVTVNTAGEDPADLIINHLMSIMRH